MSELLQALSQYGWWIAGLVLLLLEVVAPGAYLIFFGFAALIVGTNAFFLADTGWFGLEAQAFAFVVVSAVAVLLGRRWYSAKIGKKDQSGLNRRTDRLMGREAVLTDPIVGGRGRVALEDGWWNVEGPDTPVKSRVRVIGARGSLLLVEPIGNPDA